MKKILIILGIIAVVVFLLIVAFSFMVFRAIHKAEGPALYSSMGAWTRIQEFAHAEGKTNDIAFADKQVAQIQTMLDEWKKTVGSEELSKLHAAQAAAYAQEDKNIKNGQNPLAFLNDTNLPQAVFSSSTNQ
jgi:hypothetical protein